MVVTLESLAKRVEELEQQFTDWRGLRIQELLTETPAQRGARMLREARATAALHAALVGQAFRELGIPQTPIMTIEELHELQRKEGIRSEDNIGSRGIIDMREE